jgi:hypothetical protein
VNAMEELTWVFLKGFHVLCIMQILTTYGFVFLVGLVSGLLQTHDYGIDFAHLNPPTPLFRYLCNNKYCVNSTRTKAMWGKKTLSRKNQAVVIETKGGKSSRRHQRKKNW